MIRLHLDLTKPGTHLVEVTQTFPAADAPERRFRMAAWVPGSYKIRDFGRHVQEATCTVDGKKRPVAQVRKDEWLVTGTAGKEVSLTFKVYCRELTVDTSHVTSDHAHLFMATIALYDHHSRGLPHEVVLKKPRGWVAYSGLQTKFDGPLGAAEDYDHLIDCPIEVGPANAYHTETFTVRRKPHRIIVWQPPTGVDWSRIRKETKAIVEATAKLWGNLPYEHYTFMAHVAMNLGGGLEHRNSTVLGTDPQEWLVDERIKGRLYPLIAHEFFHTWNVKRIQPALFQPYNLQTEVYTGLLWLFEGFTTYYELPLLARAGVVDDEAFGKITSEMLKYYEMALGRDKRSVADCSKLTWSLLYQPHEHNVNRNVSYYTKGLFVALCLDAHLREQGVKDGLDVVMRLLWKKHHSVGIAEDAFPALVEEATGVNVATLLKRWTEGTSELPVDKSLKFLGWTVKREHPDKETPNGLGVHFKPKTAIIERIPEDGPSFEVLQPEDQIVAVNGWKWEQKRFAKEAALLEPGDTVEISFFREGRLRAADVPVREMPKDKITIKPVKKDAAATRRRNAWLQG